jgi:hypothetical protein
MDGPVGDWLVAGFTILGIYFQNWMPLVFVIFALYILYEWVTGGFGGSS